MNTKRWVLSIFSTFVLAAFAMAVPTLDQLIGYEPAIGPSGADSVYLTDLTYPETSISSLVLEAASFSNEFGLYNLADPSKRLLVIDGAVADPGVLTITEVQFDLVTGVATITKSYDPTMVGNSTVIGTTFGFYLDSSGDTGGGLFFTDESLNGDSIDHGLIYAPPGSGYVYSAWEDVYGGGDLDYDDFVVRVSDVSASVSVVPTPGAVLLAGLGIGLVGWLRRQKRF